MVGNLEALASRLLRTYRLRVPVDLEPVLAGEELEIVYFPFAGRVHEAIVGHVIGIKKGITHQRYVRELVAHAIGHHLLHSGNQLVCLHRIDLLSSLVQEREAQEFAMRLLVPQHQLLACLRSAMPTWDLAEFFMVTEPFMQERIRLLSRDQRRPSETEAKGGLGASKTSRGLGANGRPLRKRREATRW